MKARFTDEQIIAMIKEQEAGDKTADVCRRHGISSATFYKYKSKYGGMEPSNAKRSLFELSHAKRFFIHLKDSFLFRNVVFVPFAQSNKGANYLYVVATSF
ncbi:transposase [Epibacterium ulvae]|uniref:transposase n=1 Tax=Epibacterium ulvae TaxID=1156985 RepID=UPI003EB6ACCE